MSKASRGWWAMSAAPLFLALAIGCAPSFQTAPPAAAGAVSVEQLQANLEAFGGSGGRALVPASSIPKPSGSPFSAAELAAFVGGIKTELASFIGARGSNKPYLVLPVRLRAAGQSGLMWLPVSLGRTLSLPIILYQHGTEVFWKCAPSRYDPNPLSVLAGPDVTGAFLNYMECTTAALMASAGYIVVMADYPGFGDSRAPHPYVTLSLGDSVLTMLGAAQAALASPFAAARPNGKIFLIGYSEGGFVTMAAAKTLQDHGLRVTAAVPCAGSYDMSGAMVADILSGRPAVTPYYVPYTVFGYASVYGPIEPSVWNYASLLKDPLPALLPSLFSGNATGAVISAAMPSAVPLDLLTPGLAADLAAGQGGVYARLWENTVFHTGWVPNMPIQMVHCPIDDVVPAANALAVAAAWSGLPNVLPPIWVPPLPLTSITDTHILAFPAAMLAGFGFIDAVNAK